MSRTLRAILGVIFVMVIMFSAISICQNLGKSLRWDVTERKIYTLSDGTKAILGRLNQPIKVKLYYAKTAALKAPDQIKFFNNYYFFVRALLGEYEKAAQGMIDLEVIDPRPYSEEEATALRHRLEVFPITEEENFFFGLVVQTPFGVVQSIPFFSPNRQQFVEYDISYMIDTAITRRRSRIGLLSSLPVMGDDVSGYMAQMMQMQGRRPQPPWTIVTQLRQQYELTKIETEVDKIEDVDILWVIHPKDLPEKTLWAIDQFVLAGGRTIICVDPHAMVDQPSPQQQMTGQMPKTSSNLNQLLRTWGLEMPDETFAGDRSLALTASLGQNQRAQKIIGFMELQRGCFNQDNALSSELNQVRILFAGALQETADEPQQVELTPLLYTTNQGNTWTANSFELTMIDPDRLMQKFQDGTKPVSIGYLVTGKFKSSFPEGIEAELGADPQDQTDDPQPQPQKQQLTGLTEGDDCAVAVFADVDFISDIVAYQQTFFGAAVVGDNSTLLLNTVEHLSGSGDLIAIRSRGNFQRPFTVVDEIERKAEMETAEEEANINAQIAAFQQELSQIIAQAKSKGETLIDASELAEAKAQRQLKIRQAQVRLRELQNRKRQQIEQLAHQLQNLNMFPGPGAILLLAIVLGIRRSARRRHYISHASDA